METLIPEPFPDDESRNKDIRRQLEVMMQVERLRSSAPFIGSTSLAQYPSRSSPN